MARSKLTNPTNDIVNDGGAVLWSIIKGEQLEFPVTVNFISNIATGYTFEAVVVEANNLPNQASAPTTIKTGGVQTTLTVRVPTVVGSEWSGTGAYGQADVVKYNNKYYERLAGLPLIDPTTPDLSPLWVETTLNKLYIQFPSSLGGTWEVQPTVGFPSYGFFELRITEPTNPVYQKTWKPVRGMVEILFSPTDVVA